MDNAALYELRTVLARIHKQVSNQLAAADVLDYAAGQVAVLGFAATVTRCDGDMVLRVAVDPAALLADVARWKALEAGAEPEPVEDAQPVEKPEAIEEPEPIEEPESVEEAVHAKFTGPLSQAVKDVVADMKSLMRAANIDRAQFIALLFALARGNPPHIIAAELRRPVALINCLIKVLPEGEWERRQLRHVLEVQEAGGAT